jgi:hypothetical protein
MIAACPGQDASKSIRAAFPAIVAERPSIANNKALS